ncbi:MAG: ThuA domain-containing protein [Lentisphaeraceae bacterium]|nr:ThuA domain-containing protein [Lentisphaeraceae bacterium]
MKVFLILLFTTSILLHAENIKIHFVGASKEYKAEQSLKAYKQILEKTYKVSVSETYTKDKSKEAPGFEKVKEADVLLVFARRLTLNKEALSTLKAYLDSGRPVIGIRTASHAFQNFLELDKQYFGGSYNGHGKTMDVKMSTEAASHEILKGVDVTGWSRSDKPYYNDKNASDVSVLLKGTEPGGRVHPMAWTRLLGKQRIFYTSLGLPDDFKNPKFIRLLNNSLEWVSEGKLEKK